MFVQSSLYFSSELLVVLDLFCRSVTSEAGCAATGGSGNVGSYSGSRMYYAVVLIDYILIDRGPGFLSMSCETMGIRSESGFFSCP